MRNRATFLSLWIFGVLLVSFLGSCSGGRKPPSYNPNIGPFDEKGNYVEEWADNPPKNKRGWFTRKSSDLPESKPKKAKTSKKATQSKSQKKTARRSVETSSKTKPKVQEKPKAKPKTQSKPKPKTQSKPKAKPKTQPKPKPKTQPKPKPKPKPKRRHKVIKGDTLYSLSRKFGTTVGAIQKANGLSGTNIRIGQTLVIP